MIEKIEMRNCASYDETGVELSDCSKINFIYGPNGSGKSTISNFFQDLTNSKYRDCSVTWEISKPMDVLVYNRRFRESNFSGDIDGVFTLGKDIIEDKQNIEKLKNEKEKRLSELSNLRNCIETKKKQWEKTKSDFQDTVWKAILKDNEADFQQAFTGYRASKEKFLEQVLKRYDEGHSSPYTKEELLERATTLFSKKQEPCDIIELHLDEVLKRLSDIELNPIWSKHIVGNQDVPIAKLIEFLGNTDWVKNGIQYIRDGNICPFCQRETITRDLRTQLEQFFSGQYEMDTQLINSLIRSYTELSTALINTFSEICANERYFTIAKIEYFKVEAIIGQIKACIDSNLSEMKSKKDEPSKSVSIQGISLYEIQDLFNNGNIAITKHNNRVKNYEKEKIKLINDIWCYLLDIQEALISGYLNDKIKYKKAIDGMTKSIELSEQAIQTIDNQIIEITKGMTSVQPTVNEINRLLKAYGFNNFQIAPSPIKENAYQIQRPDGTLANDTLSEGEETFISFLYFLQLTKGATNIEKVSSDKVLIIDDPICSLDSTILYIVSSLVKSLVEDVKDNKTNIKQIFILTHNVFFHKEASFVNGVADQSKDVRYWIIHKDKSMSHINSYSNENPIHTSYELLWRELKESNSTSYISIQNTMRRIIENYFGMLGNKKYSYLEKEFSSIEEQQICKSLFYWINDGSHSIPDDLYIDSYSDSIEKYKDVFRAVFEKSGHIAHYNMMMGIQDES